MVYSLETKGTQDLDNVTKELKYLQPHKNTQSEPRREPKT